jgi:hypothetical protein
MTVALALIIHLTTVDGAPVASRDEALAIVRSVNELYRDSDVCFVPRIEPNSRNGDLVTHRDRRAFVADAQPGALNVFVVRSIRDEEPSPSTQKAAQRAGRQASGWLNGAEIPAPRLHPPTYLLVRLGAGANTMGHELGHLLGEGHHPDPANLMSYGTERHTFDAAQRHRMHRRATTLASELNAPVGDCWGQLSPPPKD